MTTNQPFQPLTLDSITTQNSQTIRSTFLSIFSDYLQPTSQPTSSFHQELEEIYSQTFTQDIIISYSFVWKSNKFQNAFIISNPKIDKIKELGFFDLWMDFYQSLILNKFKSSVLVDKPQKDKNKIKANSKTKSTSKATPKSISSKSSKTSSTKTSSTESKPKITRKKKS